MAGSLAGAFATLALLAGLLVPVLTIVVVQPGLNMLQASADDGDGAGGMRGSGPFAPGMVGMTVADVVGIPGMSFGSGVDDAVAVDMARAVDFTVPDAPGVGGMIASFSVSSSAEQSGADVSDISVATGLTAGLTTDVTGVTNVTDVVSVAGAANDVSDASNTNDTSDPTNPWQRVTVSPGDSLSTIFIGVGLSAQTMHQILNSGKEANVLRQIHPGYQLDFLIAEGGKLEQLKVETSPLENFRFTRNTPGTHNYDTYTAEAILIKPEVRQTFKVGTISDSLFMAAQRESIPVPVIMQMTNIFGGVIDFMLDTRNGDEFGILYEEQYLNDEFVGYGDIVASRFMNNGQNNLAVRYEHESGEIGYYNPAGESVQRDLLRNPLDIFRISSDFNLRRRHPILNTIRAHKGTDYAAPTGTPVRATKSGRVDQAVRSNSFGNLVVLKHSGGLETKYAHLSRYIVSEGDRVRQGEIIGYVGSTGLATGPHLHYELLVNGVHRNPRRVHDSLAQAESVAEEEMSRFHSQTAHLFAVLNGVESGELSNAQLANVVRDGADSGEINVQPANVVRDGAGSGETNVQPANVMRDRGESNTQPANAAADEADVALNESE